MNNLDERLYDYLTLQSGPKSIGEINSEKEFQELPRRELAQTLQKLESKNVIFRSLKDGKAYYSVNSSVYSSVDVSEVQLTYQENKEVDCDGYKMKIPDGFEITQEEGRDFVAYLKNEKAEENDWRMGGALITILPSMETPMKLEKEFHLREIYTAVYEVFYWTGTKEAFEALGGEPEFFPVVVETTAGGCIHTSLMENSHHYYFMFYNRNGFKQIHIQVDNIRGTEAMIREKMLQIAEGFVLKNRIEPLMPLNDKTFVNQKIDETTAKKWTKLLKDIRDEYHTLFQMKVNGVEKARIQYESNAGTFLASNAKKRIRTYLKEEADAIDNILAKVLDFYNAQLKLDAANPVLLKIYEEVERFISENENVTVTVDDEELSESVETISDVREQLKSEEIENMLKERTEAEERKKDQKEQEMARKRKSVENVRHMIYGGGGSCFVVMPNGRVLGHGIKDHTMEEAISSWKNVVAVSGGSKHIVGLKEDGTVVAAGDNYFGQCNVSQWKNIISIATGYNHTVGLCKDGTVVATGNRDRDYHHNIVGGDACNVDRWKDIVEIAAGEWLTVGRKADGTIVMAGEHTDPSKVFGSSANKGLEMRSISNWPPVIAIAAVRDNIFGITKAGELVSTTCIPDIEKWNDLISISAGASGAETLVGVRLDGTVIGYWDRLRNDQGNDVSVLKDVIYAVDQAGYEMNSITMALREDGKIECVPKHLFSQKIENIKLFNNCETVYEEKMEELNSLILSKEQELEKATGLFARGKRKSLMEEISELKIRLAKVQEKI